MRWAFFLVILCACSPSVVQIDDPDLGAGGASAAAGASPSGGAGATGGGGSGSAALGGASPAGGAGGSSKGGAPTGGASGGATTNGGSAGTGAVPVGGTGGAPETARCDRSKPFGAPTTILENPTEGEQNEILRLTPDELVGYLKWIKSDYKDGGLRTVSRASIGEPWSAPVSLDFIAPGIPIGIAAPTADRLNLIMDVFVKGQWQIARSSRNTTAEPFSAPVVISSIPAGFDPSVTADGSQFFYSSVAEDLLVSTQVAGEYGAGVAVSALNSLYEDRYPAVSPSGKVIYFSSARPVVGGPAQNNIWRAERASSTAAWGAPVLVPELSSEGHDIPSYVTDDDCVYYGRQGVADLFVAFRPK